MSKHKRRTLNAKHGFVLDMPIHSVDEKLAYQAWNGMIKRVHSTRELKKFPTYKGCSICVEWKKFSKFFAWHKKNHRHGFHLDKDIMYAGNKKYSPKRCRYVPARINTLFLDSGSIRGKYPQGVHLYRKSGTFIARVRLCDGSRNKLALGAYKTVREASKAYQKAKAEVIIRVAKEEYRDGNISKEICDRLIQRALKRNFVKKP